MGDGARVLADAAEAGDEPVMLARALPGVVVAVGRGGTAWAARWRRASAARVHVLDDGFQHLRLARDLDVRLRRAGGPRRIGRCPRGGCASGPSASARADSCACGRTRDGRARGRLGATGSSAWAAARRASSTWTGRAAAAPARALPAVRASRSRSGSGGRGGRRCRASPAAPLSATTIGSPPEELRPVADEARGARADAIVTTAKDAVRLPRGARRPARARLPHRGARSRTRRASASGCWPRSGGRREARAAARLRGPRGGRRVRGSCPACRGRGPGPGPRPGTAAGPTSTAATCRSRMDNLRHAFPRLGRGAPPAHGPRGLRPLRPDDPGHPLAATATRATRSCPAWTWSAASTSSGPCRGARAPSS